MAYFDITGWVCPTKLHFTPVFLVQVLICTVDLAFHVLQVFGLSRVDVQELFVALRAEGDLEIIGAEASVIESKWQRWVIPAQYVHLLELHEYQAGDVINSLYLNDPLVFGSKDDFEMVQAPSAAWTYLPRGNC